MFSYGKLILLGAMNTSCSFAIGGLFMKRLLSLVLAFSMLFAFVSCGDDALSKQDAIEKSLDALEDLDSFRCESSIVMDFVTNGEPWHSVDNTVAEVNFDNDLYHATVNLDSTEEQMDAELYMDISDNPQYYLSMNGTWLKMGSDAFSAMSESAIGLHLYDDFKVYYDLLLNEEQCILTDTWLEGENYYELAAPVTLTSLDALERLGLDPVVRQFIGEDQSELNSVLSVMGPITVSVFLYKDSLLPYGYMVDITEQVKALYSAINMDATVNAVYSSAIYSDFDDLDELAIPDEAKNAVDLSLGASDRVIAAPDANPEILNHLKANGNAMIESFDASFSNSSGRECESTITVTSNGFVLDCKTKGLRNVPAELKAQLQATYDSAQDSFNAMFKPLKDVLPQLEQVRVNICDEVGEVLATINVNF